MDVATVNINHTVAVKKKRTVIHSYAIYTTDGCCVLDSSATGAALSFTEAAPE
jgi:hypothetical protein